MYILCLSHTLLYTKNKNLKKRDRRVNNRSVNDIGEIFDTFFPSLLLLYLLIHMCRGGEQYQSRPIYMYIYIYSRENIFTKLVVVVVYKT